MATAPTLLARGAALLFASLALGGCRAGYDVSVRNLTHEPVTASLLVPHTDGAPQAARSRYIGPGDRASLFVQADSSARVTLSVDSASNTGHPATIDLSRGQTIVNVRRPGEAAPAAPARLQLEEVPRP